MPSKTTPKSMDDVYSKPGHLFRRMQQIAVAIFMEECKGFDLTPVQYASLVAVRDYPGIDATRLSALIAFDGPELRACRGSNTVNRLPCPGWLSISICPPACLTIP